MPYLFSLGRIVRSAAAGSVFACIFLLCPNTACSQANSATLYGSVSDPAGAVVPAASVTLVAQDTGATIKKTTDDSGDFAFNFVPGGNYTLRIEAKGFRPYAATGMTLVAGQQIRHATLRFCNAGL